jgi:hypothetical protein
MSLVESILAVQQTNGLGSQESNPPAAEYFVVALVAVVLGLIVWVFIRSSMRRSSKP